MKNEKGVRKIENVEKRTLGIHRGLKVTAWACELKCKKINLNLLHLRYKI